MTSKTEHTSPEPDEAELPDADIVEEPEPEAEEDLTPEERMERERDEYYENWRRVQADFQNHRRRQTQVIAAAVSASKRELLGELLLTLDYLDMALKSPVETQEGKNLLMGVKMTRDQMMQFLAQREVEPIDSQGNFDPTQHEAIENVTGTGLEAGAIVETIRTGYTLGKDILRHAHVKVAADDEPEPVVEATPEATPETDDEG